MALTLAMSQVYDYSFLLLFGAPRVCLWIEIRRYKNTIRIRTVGYTNNAIDVGCTTIGNKGFTALIAG